MTLREMRHLKAPIAFVIAAALGVVANAQAPDRSKPPAIGSAPALKLPTIQKMRLANGLAVWIVEQHEVPVAQVNLIVRSGSAADPAGKYGVGSFTAAMLDEGAGSRSALELADAIEFLGASIVTASTFDASFVRLSVPVARLADALPLAADIALRPVFPLDELERLRKQRLTSFLQARDSVVALAQIAFARTVYGSAHRYGTSANGVPASIERLSADDVRGFYRAHYRPDNATVIVVGDVTPASVMPLLDKAFGAWKAEGNPPSVAQVPLAPQLERRQVYLVDKPGAAQSHIGIGWVGLPRSTPDYAKAEVLNTILGGSFTSRLNQNLREKNGYAYGARSGFDMRASAGPFLAQASVQTDKTADALREFFVELRGMHTPIPADELTKAKNYVALGFPGEFETTGDLARKLEELVVYGLPEDTFSGYVPKVTQLTSADMQGATAQYIQPDRMAVVVVGDRRAIEAGIRALDLGPITVVPIDELFK
jgi:zinc protease